MAAAKVEVARKNEVADLPLGTGYAIACFLLADLIGVIIAMVHSANGKKRASREAWRFIGYGWILRIAVIVLGITCTRM